MLLQLVAAVALVAAFGRRASARATGDGQMSIYFKQGTRCMTKPYADLPAYEIGCGDWERERLAEQKTFFGEEPR